VSVSFSPKKHTITFEHKQTQYKANPRGSERQRVNLGLSDPQTVQAKHTCCRCRAKPPLLQRRRFRLPPMKAVMFSKVLKSLSLLLCGAKPKLAFSAWNSFDCESDSVKRLFGTWVCENERPRIYKYIYIYIYLFSCFFWAEELRAGNLYCFRGLAEFEFVLGVVKERAVRKLPWTVKRRCRLISNRTRVSLPFYVSLLTHPNTRLTFFFLFFFLALSCPQSSRLDLNGWKYAFWMRVIKKISYLIIACSNKYIKKKNRKEIF
jgi:hypothetical protein